MRGVTGQEVVINLADGRHAGVALRQNDHRPLAKQVRVGLGNGAGVELAGYDCDATEDD